MSTVYFNGNILTMDDGCPRVQAIYVDGGRILKRGTDAEILAQKGADTVCIDLEGKTMLPGFIDGHSHFAGLANSLAQCDLAEAGSFRDIVARMKDYIRENQIPAGQWVVGTNYDHNFLEEQRHPDKQLLDGVSAKHPVLIVHASSHMGVANSLGLESLGLTEAVPDPQGGRYGRTASGALSGYMEENAFVNFRNAMPMPELDAFMDLFRKAQEVYAGYGITTVQEGMVTEPLLGLLRAAREKKVLYLDLVGYLDLENCRDPLSGREVYRDHFRIGGYKIFLDGSPQGRTAWMKEPYVDSENGYRGYPIKEDGQLYDMICTALKEGQQLLAHCNGDAAAEQFVTQFEKVLADHPAYDANRPVMIHGQLVQREQLERMGKIGMMPSFFAAHTYYWGDIHIRNFGQDRADNISPAGWALDLGLPFTFHQDSPVLMPDVLRTVWCAARRITKEGAALGEDQRISVYDALKAVTIHGAYQYFEEDWKGSIEEGKLADLVILDRDPLEVPLDEVKNIRVLATIKEGREVYRRK